MTTQDVTQAAGPDAEPSVPVTRARAEIADVVGRAEHGGQRTVLTRHGRAVAAVVPVADLERLRELDAAAALERVRDDARVVTTTMAVHRDPATVWRSLVEATTLRRWWPGVVLVDEVGVGLAGVDPAEAEVVDVAPARLLVLSWRDPGGSAASTVRLELLADGGGGAGAGGGTTVVLTHRGLPDDGLAAAHRAAWEQRVAAWRAVLEA